MGLKLQRAEGVGDALQGILNGVGEVVHGVDAPLVALTVVVLVVDAVDDRVTHVEVAGGQIDLGPQRHGAVGELTGPHALEQIQALLNGPVPVGALGGGAHIAAHVAHLLGGQLADVGQTLFDEVHGALVHFLKVIRGIEEPVAPVEAQPTDILLDGLHILHILLGGVGVVHAEVAQAVIFFGGAEVDDQGLAVTDVQVAVGLRREPGVYGHTLVLTAGGNVLVDKGVDKIAVFRGLDFFCHSFRPLRRRSGAIIVSIGILYPKECGVQS